MTTTKTTTLYAHQERLLTRLNGIGHGVCENGRDGFGNPAPFRRCRTCDYVAKRRAEMEQENAAEAARWAEMERPL